MILAFFESIQQMTISVYADIIFSPKAKYEN